MGFPTRPPACAQSFRESSPEMGTPPPFVEILVGLKGEGDCAIGDYLKGRAHIFHKQKRAISA